MHAADFNADAGVVTVRTSKAGKPRHVVLTEEGQRLFARLTAGKLGHALVLQRDGEGVWGKARRRGRSVVECAAARIKIAVSFHILRVDHTARRWQ